jgi:hypothetical protein
LRPHCARAHGTIATASTNAPIAETKLQFLDLIESLLGRGIRKMPSPADPEAKRDRCS